MINYDDFAKTFSNSRKNLKWEEIDYFLTNYDLNGKKVLDVGCGNARLLQEIKNKSIKITSYLGIDLSSLLLEEARKLHKDENFLNLNMLDLDKLKDSFDCIFFIASFHHLQNIEDRIEVLKKAKKLLNKNGKIFFTNWNLLGQEKYKKQQIINSGNEFGSLDFDIKIGKFYRYYHSFSLFELEYLFKEAGFQIIENRIFENGKNIVSVIEQ